MSLKPFIEIMLSRLWRVRNAINNPGTEYWGTLSRGCISGAFLVGGIDVHERDRLDELVANAQNIRESELRKQGVFA